MHKRLLNSSKHLELYVIGEKSQIAPDYPDKGLLGPEMFNIYWKKEYQFSYTHELAIGTFTLVPMPGCCGAVVSTSLFLEKQYRGTPIGKEFMELKEWTPEYLGYSAVFATIQLKNLAELKSSAKRQYKIIGNWKNDRTGNHLAIIFKKTNP